MLQKDKLHQTSYLSSLSIPYIIRLVVVAWMSYELWLSEVITTLLKQQYLRLRKFHLTKGRQMRGLTMANKYGELQTQTSRPDKPDRSPLTSDASKNNISNPLNMTIRIKDNSYNI